MLNALSQHRWKVTMSENGELTEFCGLQNMLIGNLVNDMTH